MSPTTTVRTAAEALAEALRLTHETYDVRAILATFPIDHESIGHGVTLAASVARGDQAAGLVLTFVPVGSELRVQGAAWTDVPAEAVPLALDAAGWTIGLNEGEAARVARHLREHAGALDGRAAVRNREDTDPTHAEALELEATTWRAIAGRLHREEA